MYTNVKNGKIYIGQTSTTLEERAQSNGSNYKESPRFYAAIQQYGWDSFVPSIIDTANTREESMRLEEYYISLYNSDNPEVGYNISGGIGENYIAAETRTKLSESATERYRDKTKNPMFGKKHSAETLGKMSAAKRGKLNPMYGTTHNERQRMLCGTKGKKLNLSDERRQELAVRGKQLGELRKMKCRCLEDGTVYDSLTEAAAHYGVSISSLNGHLKGRQHTCAGKHFEYVSDD